MKRNVLMFLLMVDSTCVRPGCSHSSTRFHRWVSLSLPQLCIVSYKYSVRKVIKLAKKKIRLLLKNFLKSTKQLWLINKPIVINHDYFSQRKWQSDCHNSFKGLRLPTNTEEWNEFQFITISRILDFFQ